MNITKSIVAIVVTVLLSACGGGDAPDKTGRTDTPSTHGLVSSLAGVGAPGFSDGKISRLSSPTGIAVDRDGNLYFADTGNHSIRKETVDGVVSTLAGNGVAGFADGEGAAARFSNPSGVAVDGVGNVYVADSGNHRIRKILPTGEVSTLAGSDKAGYLDSAAPASATFDDPRGIVVNSSGTEIYVSDFKTSVIRKITDAGVTTVAGVAGVTGADNGAATAARFTKPWGLALSAGGDLYIADSGDWTGSNQLIRKINLSSGDVSTVAGITGVAGKINGVVAEATFSNPSGVAVDSNGNVYVADTGNSMIRKITATGDVTTLAGDGTAGALDATGTDASFNSPRGIAVDIRGDLYVADTDNHLIRKVKK